MFFVDTKGIDLATAKVENHFESAKLFAIGIEKRYRRRLLTGDSVHHFSLCAVDDLTRNVSNLRCLFDLDLSCPKLCIHAAQIGRQFPDVLNLFHRFVVF